MIARSAPPFTLRNILDRVGLASMHQGFCREGAIRLNLWQRIFAALGDWSSLSATRSLTNSGRVGMPKYASAGNAGGKT